MKRLLGFIFILFLGAPFGQAQVIDLAFPAFPVIDSSVGKPPFQQTAFMPSDMVSHESFLGKPPYIMTIEGPAPQTAGPGLRFNTKKWFYIYTDRGAAPNHFVPSGWMGDFNDLRLDMDSHENPADGKTCIKISYSAAGGQNVGWAGMYWQQPVNNWGNKPGGFNLKGMKQITFWARGAAGGEVIGNFKVGGIQGEIPDTDSVQIGPVVLTSDWKKYVIDLSAADLSRISGGFAWAASQDDNPHGMTFYLDEIRFER